MRNSIITVIIFLSTKRSFERETAYSFISANFEKHKRRKRISHEKTKNCPCEIILRIGLRCVILFPITMKKTNFILIDIRIIPCIEGNIIYSYFK